MRTLLLVMLCMPQLAIATPLKAEWKSCQGAGDCVLIGDACSGVSSRWIGVNRAYAHDAKSAVYQAQGNALCSGYDQLNFRRVRCIAHRCTSPQELVRIDVRNAE